MFNIFSSSSSDTGEFVKRKDGGKTKTVTIVYADTSHLDHIQLDSTESTTPSETTLTTPTSTVSGQSLLDQLDKEKEKDNLFGYYPIWRDMSLSDGPKLATLKYFWGRKIFQLFNFLITHLLAQTPEDPIPFLLSLVERCIQYRDEGGDPPLVFEESHIHSVYVALDPLIEGSISYSQYLTGMQTLGLTEFNIVPDDMDSNRNVAKDVFIREAKDALIKQLDLILGKGRESISINSEEFKRTVDYDVSSNMRNVTVSKDSGKSGGTLRSINKN